MTNNKGIEGIWINVKACDMLKKESVKTTQVVYAKNRHAYVWKCEINDARYSQSLYLGQGPLSFDEYVIYSAAIEKRQQHTAMLALSS